MPVLITLQLSTLLTSLGTAAVIGAIATGCFFATRTPPRKSKEIPR